ncbi:MAG TPA: cation:proton antiporter [Abditibacterium sp.]|jgi:CPA2 family monovalent cation:H+ antiporter-2
MPHHSPADALAHTAALFIELGAIVIGLSLLARLALRMGLTPIPFYLIAGLFFGSGGVHTLSLSSEFVRVEAEIGVILLLFMLGLEYSATELSSSLKRGFRAGVLDGVLNFLPGLVLGFALGWKPIGAILLGGVTWISSSSIIAKVLGDLDRLGNRETSSILSVLVLEDLAMAVYLPLVAVLLLGLGFFQGAVSVGVALGTVILVLAVALKWGDRLSKIVEHASGEVVLLSVFGLVLLVAGVAQKLQVSAAIGAFLVGLALSGVVAERSHELLGPLRDLFAATFFFFVGLSIDPKTLPAALPIALLLAVVSGATKIATGWIAAGWEGIGARGRMRAGLTLVARGEFSVVIAGLGAQVEPRLAPLAAAYVLILAVVGPILTRFSDFFSDRLEAFQERRNPATEEAELAS